MKYVECSLNTVHKHRWSDNAIRAGYYILRVKISLNTIVEISMKYVECSLNTVHKHRWRYSYRSSLLHYSRKNIAHHNYLKLALIMLSDHSAPFEYINGAVVISFVSKQVIIFFT